MQITVQPDIDRSAKLSLKHCRARFQPVESFANETTVDDKKPDTQRTESRGQEQDERKSEEDTPSERQSGGDRTDKLAVEPSVDQTPKAAGEQHSTQPDVLIDQSNGAVLDHSDPTAVDPVFCKICDKKLLQPCWFCDICDEKGRPFMLQSIVAACAEIGQGIECFICDECDGKKLLKCVSCNELYVQPSWFYGRKPGSLFHSSMVCVPY